MIRTWRCGGLVGARAFCGLVLVGLRCDGGNAPRPGALRPAPVLLAASELTLGIRGIRILATWSARRAAGIDLNACPYFVIGSLSFLVMLVHFTFGGFAVRGACFVTLFGTLGIDPHTVVVAAFLIAVATAVFAVFDASILPWTRVLGPRCRPALHA